jgi:hypothetical protein
MQTTKRRRMFALAAASTVFVALYLNVLRPWHRNWGATEPEQAAALPGDDIVTSARSEATSTHAITIQAPVGRVWPWVAQLGQDRGGFYSYELLEDLVGCEIENATQLLPDRQQWKLGDKLWMVPPEKLDGMGHAVLARLVPGRALGFATRQAGTAASAPYDGSWSFVLEPIDATHTRLLVRGRAGGERSARGKTFDVFVFEPMHFIMERKMMDNVKRLAEGRAAAPLSDSLEVVLLAMSALGGLIAMVQVFRSVRWQRALTGFVAAALTFHVLAFLQPGPGVGAVLVALLGCLVAWAQELTGQEARAALRVLRRARRPSRAS